MNFVNARMETCIFYLLFIQEIWRYARVCKMLRKIIKICKQNCKETVNFWYFSVTHVWCDLKMNSKLGSFLHFFILLSRAPNDRMSEIINFSHYSFSHIVSVQIVFEEKTCSIFPKYSSSFNLIFLAFISNHLKSTLTLVHNLNEMRVYKEDRHCFKDTVLIVI